MELIVWLDLVGPWPATQPDSPAEPDRPVEQKLERGPGPPADRGILRETRGPVTGSLPEK
jgi:hypothetical protein